MIMIYQYDDPVQIVYGERSTCNLTTNVLQIQKFIHQHMHCKNSQNYRSISGENTVYDRHKKA